MARAFADEWLRLSKQPALEQPWAEGSQLSAEAGQADAAFLAMDEAQAAAAKPALPADLACYGTSQINARNPSADLSGTKFLDMPWFLMPDHPAVRRYERPAAALTMQTERLYALGIDAFRVAQAMANKMPPVGWQLDGVTGDLRLKRDRQFERELPVSIINGAKP
jgi:outer membrane PBP1 activator LpoA protein